jgi:hypothetical protein
MKVFEGVGQIGMPHESLYDQKVGALFEQMGSEAMTECMRRVLFLI